MTIIDLIFIVAVLALTYKGMLLVAMLVALSWVGYNLMVIKAHMKMWPKKDKIP